MKYFFGLVFLICVLAIRGDSPPMCQENEQLNGCGKRCEDTCENVLIPNRPCVRICDPPACVCKKGFARNSNGTCVQIGECPEEGFKCPANEEVNGCRNMCEKKCGDPPNKPCLLRCDPPECRVCFCVCKENFARKNNVCVPINDC